MRVAHLPLPSHLPAHLEQRAQDILRDLETGKEKETLEHRHSTFSHLEEAGGGRRRASDRLGVAEGYRKEPSRAKQS